MASTITSLINCNFGGIRRKDAIFSQDKITCSDCQNVELYFTKLNSGVGIRTSPGNFAVNDLVPVNEEVIGIFESIQLGEPAFFVYCESLLEGKLYYFDTVLNTFQTVLSGLSVTGCASGCDYTQGYLDVFVFSNGVDVKYIYSNTSTASSLNVAPDTVTNADLYTISGNTVTKVSEDATGSYGKITATVTIDETTETKTLLRNKNADTKIVTTDYYGWTDGTDNFYSTENVDVLLYDIEGRRIKGLGVVNYNNRIWIFDKNVVWYSRQGECRDFNFNDPDVITSAGFIETTKDITAIYPYLGALALFHKDSSCLINEDSTTGFTVSEESPGGCASYDALCFHGTDLYFYDDTKKGVFSFQQIVNGDKTLGNNIALDIQDELLKIRSANTKKIRTLSVITKDRNEVWFLIPITEDIRYSFIMIYDYIRGEWVKRKSQHINAIGVVNNVLYSGGKQIYQEYEGMDFDGEFIPCYYTCTILNLGEDNTLKITKFPPRLSVNSSYANHFWVKYTKNYDVLKEPKKKEIKGKSLKRKLIYNSGMNYNEGWTYKVKNVNIVVKMPSATFKALEITFYTEELHQEFCIKTIEFSKIKVKQV